MVVSRQISANPQQIRTLQARQHFSSPASALTDTPPANNDQHELFEARRTSSCVRQTVAFTDLSAELRNRIYGYAFAHKSALLVASPLHDEIMAVGVQPAITKVSRQLRGESLAMFYANTTFVAYIRDFDFRELCQWIRCITSSPTPPKVKVHVKLLDWVRCEYQLLRLMRAWRDLQHETVHAVIHNWLDSTNARPTIGRQPLWHRPTGATDEKAFDQRELVKETIRVAEGLKAQGNFTELKLREACALLVGCVAGYLPRCNAISVTGSRCRNHGISA